MTSSYHPLTASKYMAQLSLDSQFVDDDDDDDDVIVNNNELYDDEVSSLTPTSSASSSGATAAPPSDTLTTQSFEFDQSSSASSPRVKPLAPKRPGAKMTCDDNLDTVSDESGYHEGGEKSSHPDEEAIQGKIPPTQSDEDHIVVSL